MVYFRSIRDHWEIVRCSEIASHSGARKVGKRAQSRKRLSSAGII
jgi:hypothetical protein